MNIISDWGTALYTVIGVLTAVAAREKTGNGQFIEMSYLESALALLTPFHYDYLNYGTVYQRGKTFYNGGNPYYAVYRTGDGKYLTVGCNEPAFWQSLCRALGREDLVPHQYTQGAKKREVKAWLKQTFLTRTRDEWFDLLKDKDIPIGKVYSSDEVFNDPHILSREIVAEVGDPTKGITRHVGIPFRMSETPGRIRTPAPAPGEHTEEILRKVLKHTKADVARLRERQAI